MSQLPWGQPATPSHTSRANGQHPSCAGRQACSQESYSGSPRGRRVLSEGPSGAGPPRDPEGPPVPEPPCSRLRRTHFLHTRTPLRHVTPNEPRLCCLHALSSHATHHPAPPAGGRCRLGTSPSGRGRVSRTLPVSTPAGPPKASGGWRTHSPVAGAECGSARWWAA